MNNNTLYLINISLESMMVIILTFVIVSCLSRKNRFDDNKPLIILSLAVIQLLVCQISEYFFMIAGNDTGALTPNLYLAKKITYTLDYFLYIVSTLAFYNYINIHIKSRIKDNTDNIHNNNKIYFNTTKWFIFLICWSVCLSIIFGYLLNQDWFYYVNIKGKEFFNNKAYIIMYILAMLGTISCIVTLIKNRKVLTKLNLIILLFYSISPDALVLFDIINSTCFTYLMKSFFVFILYVQIDIKSEEELINHELKISKQEKELEILNTQIMISQMQPHFLYNTLSSISSLCYIEGANKAKVAVDKFADYFRENLDSLSKERFISFKKELKHIETYLWIEKMRFGDSLNINYDINALDFEVPSLLVQPLVENAVKHGIRKKEGGGTIEIKSFDKNTEYQIIIEDDGVGFDPNLEINDDRSHIGIENVQNRIKTLCDGKLDVESKIGVGSKIVMHIPKKEVN